MGARVQRVAAYAVIVRDQQILLSRLAPRLTRHEQWTLPGGGVEHGEDPRDAVVREVHEETGLSATVGATAHVFNLHSPESWRKGRRVDAHSIRIVYAGWVPLDSPEPHVVEVDGSTVDARWHPLAGVLDGSVPVVGLVREALEVYRPEPHQRLAAYALVRRDRPEPQVLLTRISASGYHSGSWTLPGGGVDHGEHPRDAVVREVREECGLEVSVGRILDVDDVSIRGNGPAGRDEDFHGVHLVFAATVAGGAEEAEPQVTEVGGTTDAAAWVSLADVGSGAVPVLDVVRTALDADAE